MKFEPFKDNFSLPKEEEKILEFWDKEKIFEKTTELIKDRPHFVFYEGPPTANGRPGIHHVLSRTVKDLICRYKVMRGFRVDRKGGWDTHGLPVEIEVEKALGLDTKNKVIEYGVAKFNQKCRDSVFTYLNDWNNITRRIGYWLDLKDAYITLTNDYIESVWWILKNYFDRDLIYKGFKTVPYCPRCGTGLSSHEVAQGYELVKDPSVFIKVKAADDDFSYLVWTTTPWTLPSNAALCMKPDADYVMVEHEGEKLVLAEALIEQVFGESKEILKKFKGKDFLKRKYVPIFDFFKDDHADDAFYVINADFVTLEDGTGIVHIAPGYGADDYEMGVEYGLPVLQAAEANGIFKDMAGPYAGKFIKDADPIILKDLKIAGKLFKKELYEHNYPFCWRCDSPLIYITRESWYIKTTQFKEQLINNNNAINWHPDEIRVGRMLNWLENNVDWALSRERFWGTPLPVWICDNDKCGHKKAVGSVEQLKKDGIDVPDEIDLHKPFIDDIKLKCDKCGGTMTRVPELIDVWFDSGSMPYAQWHYPFENKDMFEIKYPAEFISEAVDQTRGWFYSLLAISTMLFDKAPFNNVIVLEFVLDKEGKKMSKHKGNVVDPFETTDRYGADPVRWYLMSSANPWLPKKFDFESLKEVIRKYFDTLRNTYSFFALYANIDDIVARAAKDKVSVEKFLEDKAGEPDRFDRWIVSRYNSLVKEVTECFDRYDITRPVRALQNFVIEDLSNWYVRNNRRRFWAEGDDPSKMRAYLELYRLLDGVCRLSAPTAPFISEMIFRQLHAHMLGVNGAPPSVHMTPFPECDASLIDPALEEKMDLTRRIVSLGRAARSRKNLKVRQPLSRLTVSLPGKDNFAKLADNIQIIKDELNIKDIDETDKLEDYVTFQAKLNFKTAGPKLGGAVKKAAGYISGLDSDTVRQFAETGKLDYKDEDSNVSFTLTSEEIQVDKIEKEGYAVESDGPVTVALVTEITPELRDEGFARELVNKIQNMRKSSGLEVTDHIRVVIHSNDEVVAAAQKYDEFIRRETLAKQIEFMNKDNFEGSKSWNINGVDTALAVVKE